METIAQLLDEYAEFFRQTPNVYVIRLGRSLFRLFVPTNTGELFEITLLLNESYGSRLMFSHWIRIDEATDEIHAHREYSDSEFRDEINSIIQYPEEINITIL